MREEDYRIGPYRLVRRLGSGGMAETWLGVSHSMTGVRKFVALKCILPTCNDIPEYIRLFYREASIALRLQHPNVLSTWSCGPIDGRHVMVMEYLHGITLQEFMERLRACGRTVRYDIAAWIAVQILSGLEYLHTLRDESGRPMHIVHRDVTPHNIFLCFDGQCRLFDFGIVQINHEDDDTQRGMIVGKPAYMSPEQCQSAPLSGRSDDYAMAVILYEMTTGIQPFERDNEILTYNALMNDPVIAPASRVRDFPSLLSRIIMRGMNRIPERRYESSAAFADDLRMYLNVNGKTNAQDTLRKSIADLFSEDIMHKNEALAQAARMADACAPSLQDVIAQSRPVYQIPSGVAECIGVSRLEQFASGTSPVISVPSSGTMPVISVPSSGTMPIVADVASGQACDETGTPQKVAHRMKKWIFGGSQESHS